MQIESPNTESPLAPSMIQLGRRVLLLVGASAVIVLLIGMWLSWQGLKQNQTERLRLLTSLLAAQADDYFDSIGDRMEVLAEALSRIDLRRQAQTGRVLLQQFVTEFPELAGASLIQADGRVVATTTAAGTTGTDVTPRHPAWQANRQRDPEQSGLRIGRPTFDDQLRQWMLPLYHELQESRGSRSQWLEADLVLGEQPFPWNQLSLPAEINIGILRDDGVPVSRWPIDPSGKLSQASLPELGWQRDTRSPRHGEYEATASADGSYHLGSFQHLEHAPLILVTSMAQTELASMWWRQVRLPTALYIGILLVGISGYVLVTHRYIRRMRRIEECMRELSRPGPFPSSGVREIDQLITALSDTQRKLQLSAINRERLLLTAADAGTYTVRESDGTVLSADGAFLSLSGRHETEVIGHRWQDLFEVPDELRPHKEAGDTSLARRILRVAVPGQQKPRWISTAEDLETVSDGETVRHGLAINVSDREDLLLQVNAHSRRLQALWALATTRGKTDDEKMQLMLRMALDTLQMDTVQINEHRSDKLAIRAIQDNLNLFQAGQEFDLHDSLCRPVIESRRAVFVADLRADPDLYRHPVVVELGLRAFASAPIWTGSEFYGSMAFLRRAPVDDGFSSDDRAFVELLASWIGQMLLERRQRHELENMALTDALTRLTNRHAAETRFVEELARARRTGDGFSIAICDLDRFKLVNDHYGHDTGDLVLLHVAAIMKAALREGDWVARWGGEEFIIFLHQSDANEAQSAMERLRLAIKGNPVTTAHGPIDVTTSIGIGCFQGEGDLATVLSEADGCLFEAKHAGRDQVVISASTRRGTLWRAGMLQHALLENRLVPAYQVMVDLRTETVVADETLARLIETDGRILPAEDFIEAAEGINLIHVVDDVIARQSLQRCAQQLAGGGEARVQNHFINLSPQFLARRELVQALLEEAKQLYTSYGIDGQIVKPIVLEITERQLIGNFNDLLKDLQPLLDFGFRLALDDFGSGYSSFLYLASLPVSFLKIEGWMVKNMRHDVKVQGMVRHIIALARDQGLTTIAECVEDKATADLLREFGADWGQGWYFGRPVCEADPAEVIKSSRTGT